MKRLPVKKRDGWQQKCEETGFTFHSIEGGYWSEGFCYEFTAEEIDHLEAVTEELHDMCLNLVGHVIDNGLFSTLAIPDGFADLIRKSWARKEGSLYGRFDFSYDGRNEPKLLEYNADTPTSLVESSLAQWFWLEDLFPGYDQFNSIHEKLIDAFADIRKQTVFSLPFHFSCVKDHEEDRSTVHYLMDTATQAGLDAQFIFIEDIGYDHHRTKFYDLEEREITYLFKLYPWEWIITDDFGSYVLLETIHLIEPPWKMILSNKGMLPLLWNMYPGHPNLLPSSFDLSLMKSDYIRKPLLSREGANIALFDNGRQIAATNGSYGKEGFIYQQSCPLPCFDHNYTLVGSWVVNSLPAGIGIREDNTPITKNTSRFVPHYFKP